jgi:AcrR family transcriptional regulator
MAQVKKEHVRAAILESAFALFTAHGYAGTTLPMIAKGAGVSPPNVYSYFSSKLQILYAIYEPWMRQQLDRLDDELGRLRSADRRLRRIFSLLWQELPGLEHGFANNVIQAISTSTPDEEYRPHLIGWMETQIERMLLDALPAERHALVRGTELTHAIVMAMDGYIMYRHTVPDRQCSDATIDAWCRMLTAKPPKALKPARAASARRTKTANP